MTGGGYFRAERKLFDHPLFAGKPYCEGHAWMWLIANAAWQDGPKLKRGEVMVSQPEMARQFGWTRNKVRWFLKVLHSAEMVKIHHQGHHQGHNQPPSVITICNYNKYQYEAKPNNPGHNQGHNPLVKKEKNLRKDKKENIREVEADHHANFEKFWIVFPRRLGASPKAKAQQKFAAAVTSGIEAWIIIGAARQFAVQARKLQTDPRFIPMAVSWLSDQRWTDYRPDPLDKPLTDEQQSRLFAQLRAVP